MAEGLNPTQHYNGREERSDSLHRSDQESDAEGQVGNSSQSLKGSRPKKSAFQITSVVTKKEDNNHGADDADSQDELEESRVEEASSSELLDVSNISRGSQNSELDKSIVDDTVPSVSLPDRTAIPVDLVNTEETASNDGTAETNGNGPGSRFRVVKVPNPEPVKRGRWTCKDFPNEKNQGQIVQERSELSKETIHSGDSSAASSVHYVPGENALDPLGVTTGEEKRSAKRSISRQTSSRKTSVLDDIKNMITGDESKADEESAATAGAIDNKIEQAMDIVKGHLLMAVREEVEVLKEQISELLDANEKLRKENTMLRKEKGSSNPASSQLLQHESQFQGLPPNPATQMHRPSSYHQHSLPGQPQLPSSTSTGAPTEHYQQPAAHHHHPQSVESTAQPYQHIPEAQVVEQTTYQHAIPSQPSTVTTNAEQYHQSAQGQQQLPDGQYGSQQGLPAQGTTPASLTTPMSSSHPSQYQHPATLGMPHTSSEQGQYQTVPQHHQLGASQEHSQAVPPTGAITQSQQGSQPRIPHSQGDRHL